MAAKVPWTRLKAHDGEQLRVEIPVKAGLNNTQVTNAELVIEGYPTLPMTILADIEGYKLVLDPLEIDGTGVSQWKAQVDEVAGGVGPVVVAEGDFHVSAI